MRIKYIFFIVFICAFTSLRATEVTEDSCLNVIRLELEMTTYLPDTAASAVILLNEAKTNYISDKHGIYPETEYYMRIKILKDDGIEWASQQILYYDFAPKSDLKIVEVSGRTYNLEEGEITTTLLENEQIFEENIDENYKVRKFAMPAAKVGSVLEFKYKIVYPSSFFLPDFIFQYGIPVDSIQYTIHIPELFRFHANILGSVNIEVEEDEENIKYTHLYGYKRGVKTRSVYFKGKHIPALRTEEFVWCINDHLSRATFEFNRATFKNNKYQDLGVSWYDIDKALLYSFRGKNVNEYNLFKKGSIKKEVSLDNATKILAMIREKVKWDSDPTFYASKGKQVLKSGVGNRGDMNYLLINALSMAEINAFPVFVRSRSKGIILTDAPSMKNFDRMITGIDIEGNQFFCDASDIYSSWNILPEECMVENARMIRSGENRVTINFHNIAFMAMRFESFYSTWVDLTEISSGDILVESNYRFIDGNYEGEIKERYKGLSAHDFRHYFFEDKSNREEMREEFEMKTGAKISEMTTENDSVAEKELYLNYKMQTDIQSGSEYIYLNPLLLTYIKENPFQSEQRVMPINFRYNLTYRQVAYIEIPEGYTVEELPSSAIYQFDEENSFSFTYRLAHDKNKIILRYQFAQNRLLFLQDEYSILRDFFAKVVAKNTEAIVLKKTSEQN